MADFKHQTPTCLFCHLRNLLRGVERVDEIVTSFFFFAEGLSCQYGTRAVPHLVWWGASWLVPTEVGCKYACSYREQTERDVYHSISVERIMARAGDRPGDGSWPLISLTFHPIWSLLPASVPVPTSPKRTSSLATGAGRPGHAERSRETTPSALGRDLSMGKSKQSILGLTFTDPSGLSGGGHHERRYSMNHVSVRVLCGPRRWCRKGKSRGRSMPREGRYLESARRRHRRARTGGSVLSPSPLPASTSSRQNSKPDSVAPRTDLPATPPVQ
jgi:hypothetical protein